MGVNGAERPRPLVQTAVYWCVPTQSPEGRWSDHRRWPSPTVVVCVRRADFIFIY